MRLHNHHHTQSSSYTIIIIISSWRKPPTRTSRPQGQSEDPLQATSGLSLLPVIAGLDDQPATNSKRLACRQRLWQLRRRRWHRPDSDYVSRYETTRTHLYVTNQSHYFLRCRTQDSFCLCKNMTYRLLWSTHLELASDTSCWWTKGLDWGWSREVRRPSSLKGT